MQDFFEHIFPLKQGTDNDTQKRPREDEFTDSLEITEQNKLRQTSVDQQVEQEVKDL